MPTSLDRVIAEDSWYSKYMLLDLGGIWFRTSPHTRRVAVTNLNQLDVEKQIIKAIQSAPFQAILFVGFDSLSWFAITLHVYTQTAADGLESLRVDITRMGSLLETELDEIKSHNKMVQIAQLCKGNAFLKNAHVTRATYAHAWTSSRTCDSGVYAFENAMRCLQGMDADPNPQAYTLRLNHLRQFKNEMFIKQVSYHAVIDALLEAWIKDCVQQRKDFMLDSSYAITELWSWCIEKTPSVTMDELLAIFQHEYVPQSLARGSANLLKECFPQVIKRLRELSFTLSQTQLKEDAFLKELLHQASKGTLCYLNQLRQKLPWSMDDFALLETNRWAGFDHLLEKHNMPQELNFEIRTLFYQLMSLRDIDSDYTIKLSQMEEIMGFESKVKSIDLLGLSQVYQTLVEWRKHAIQRVYDQWIDSGDAGVFTKLKHLWQTLHCDLTAPQRAALHKTITFFPCIDEDEVWSEEIAEQSPAC